jgi:hypothetical protein
MSLSGMCRIRGSPERSFECIHSRALFEQVSEPAFTALTATNQELGGGGDHRAERDSDKTCYGYHHLESVKPFRRLGTRR